MKKATFQVRRARNRQFYFNLVAPNGEVIATSERYKRIASLMKGLKAVRKYARAAGIDDRFALLK